MSSVRYSVLHDLAAHDLHTPAGFIHLPALPEQSAGREVLSPSMGLETLLKGVRAAIGAIAQRLESAEAGIPSDASAESGAPPALGAEAHQV